MASSPSLIPIPTTITPMPTSYDRLTSTLDPKPPQNPRSDPLSPPQHSRLSETRAPPRRSPSLPRDSVGGGCSSEQSCGEAREHDPPPIPSRIFISSGASVGTILQWIIQVSLYAKPKKKASFIWWKDFFKDKDIHNLLSLLLPAILNSGLVQIASLTDLYFSSFVPGAAADAFILAMAPLGILSSIIILPILPAFSTLAEPSMWVRLQENLEKAILLCLVITLPVTCTFCVLAGPIVSVLFQRRMFDSSANLIGSPFWIIRELFAAVFYSLGDSKSLLLINVTAIVLNGILDWLSVTVLGAGAQGLALSTSCVTAFSVLALFLLLSKKLKGAVNVRAIGVFLPQLLASCAASGFVASLSYRTLRFFLSANTTARLAEAASISLAGLLGMSSFYFSLLLADFPGMQILNGLLKTVMKRLNFVNDVWTNV
uniref:Uncharacterized protein n=1 Tax=Ananas comosus var. bracteatus TaxID=296719 RepID=A0A6V7NP88_ANACO|nr:unnamed protein product [Ananas comosus var. bracteatus]